MFLFAFDLLELNGQDLLPEPLEARKLELGKVLSWAAQMGLQSMSTSPSPVTSCSVMPARWDWRALSLSAWAHAIAQPIAGLGQDEEPGGTCSSAGG